MKNFCCNEVADFFINFSHEHGDLVTNLKLQKLVYYAQAWHLALFGDPLFDEEFQAWVHGPVCPKLYARFKHYRWSPITESTETTTLPESIGNHLKDVIDAYWEFTAYELEQMTHTEEPWQKARGRIPIDEASSSIISKESMKSYYAKQAELQSCG